MNSSILRSQDNSSKALGLSLRSTIARRCPLSYVFSGYYYWGNGNLANQDSFGYWWSTAAYSGSNAYHLDMHSSYLNPQYNGNKAYGLSLRCVSYSTSTRRYPLSYVWSGGYHWDKITDTVIGALAEQNIGAIIWSGTPQSTTDASFLAMQSSYLNVSSYNKNVGISLRQWRVKPRARPPFS
ncbi:hypothetical protein IK112_02210 [Candidatus Saccharibacteria bacterium]|nr:hypothetical protein [Candidatus Saccharibacteria bacterium]